MGETIYWLCEDMKGEDYDEIPRGDDKRSGRSIFDDIGTSSSCG